MVPTTENCVLQRPASLPPSRNLSHRLSSVRVTCIFTLGLFCFQMPTGWSADASFSDPLNDSRCSKSLANDEISVVDANLEIAAEEFAFLGERPRRQTLENEARLILRAIRTICSEEALCSETEFRGALNHVIEKHSPERNGFWKNFFLRKVFRPSLKYTGRFTVAVVYSASFFIGALAAYQFSEGIQDPFRRVVFSTAVGALVTSLTHPFGAPIQNRLAPAQAQLSFWLWNPDEADSWGNIQRAFNDTQRLVQSVTGNLLHHTRPHWEAAGRLIKQEDFNQAARHIATSILHSHCIYGGLFYYHPSVLLDFRTWIDIDSLSAVQKIKLILLTAREVFWERNEEILQINGEGHKKAYELFRRKLPRVLRKSRETTERLYRYELTRFAFSVTMRWLIADQN